MEQHLLQRHTLLFKINVITIFVVSGRLGNKSDNSDYSLYKYKYNNFNYYHTFPNKEEMYGKPPQPSVYLKKVLQNPKDTRTKSKKFDPNSYKFLCMPYNSGNKKYIPL